MTFSANELAGLLDGTLHGPAGEVTGFVLDHRSVQPGNAFVAVQGARVDGADFAEEALRAGASVVIAARALPAPSILVPDIPAALAQMAGTLRGRFTGPVVGITGSVGKTTVKELTLAALRPLGPGIGTLGNQNTEYSSPLLWTQVTPETRSVVVEMGMRGPGQIAPLSRIHRPRVAVITNIGTAHLELLGSREAIARAKSEIFAGLEPDGMAVLPAEDDFAAFLAEGAHPHPVRTFGTGAAVDCRVIDVIENGWEGVEVKGFCLDVPWHASIPGLGRHLGMGAAAAVLSASLVGLSPQEAADELVFTEFAPLRMEVRTWRGARVLLDAYNANPASMRSALSSFRALPVAGRRWALLGDMRELGPEAPALHREILSEVGDLKVAVVGPIMTELASEFGFCAYPDAGAAREFFAELAPEDAVLIKASRALELERVLEEN